MVFTDRVVDITYNEIMPSIVDFVNNSNIFTARTMGRVKNWKGVNMQQPIRIANSTTGGSFDGLDSFDTSTTNNTRVLTWYVKAYEQSVVVPGIEKAVNGNSEKQVLSLVADRLDEAKESLSQDIGTLLYGIGAGKDFDGTTSPTYGGLSRSTTPGNAADVTAAGSGYISLSLIFSEFTAVSAAGAEKESPTIALTTPSIWDLTETLLGSQLHANYESTSIKGYNMVSGNTPNGVMVPAEEIKGAVGFNAISLRGRPMVADDKCTAGTFFWLNERYIDFHRLVSSDLKQVSSALEVTEGAGDTEARPSFLQLKDFMAPVNQFGEIGALIVMGNLICRAPRRQGKITGITGIAS